MPPDPTHRFLALGASNLARMALTLLDAVRSTTAGGVQAHAALGRGRSYGIRSRLLGRGLGGIDDCALWNVLASEPPRPTTAVVMDVGNDLLYGVEVDRILAWVDAALQRLCAPTTQLAVVGLPMPTLRGLQPWRFRLVRSVLMPGCRLSMHETLAAAERLHHGLADLAAACGATFHAPPAHWYGFDPIHLRRSCWQEAARRWCQAERATATAAPIDGTWARLRLQFAAPAERTLLGRVQRGSQPCMQFADGSTLSLW